MNLNTFQKDNILVITCFKIDIKPIKVFDEDIV